MPVFSSQLNSSETPAFSDVTHQEYLLCERERLLDHFQPRVWQSSDLGFAYLDRDGNPMPERGAELYLGARMIHCFAVAAMLGRQGVEKLAEQGVRFYLDGPGKDREYGGWYATVGGNTPSDRKELYGQAHIMLAAASATLAGIPGAVKLLEESIDLIDTKYWLDDEGRCVEAYDRTFTDLDTYRGQNANMHLTEAFLAAYEATNDKEFLKRASRIAENTVGQAVSSEQGSWRIPEHFDEEWHPLRDYNRDDPRHAFRPYGSQPGHWLEWAKLLMQIRGAGIEQDWMLPAAKNLVKGAFEDGWTREGGFVYTVDWDGSPVVTEKFWWPPAEGAGATRFLYEESPDAGLSKLYERIWRWIDSAIVDKPGGGWFHEVDRSNAPVTYTWPGQPDLYHAYQATLYPFMSSKQGIASWARSCRENNKR